MHLRSASKSLVADLKAGQRLERRLHPETSGSGDGGGWIPPSEREKKNGKPVEGGSAGRRRSASPPRSGRDKDSDKYDRRR